MNESDLPVLAPVVTQTLRQGIIAAMPKGDTSTHIYRRSVNEDANDSLSIVAGLIEPGQVLLDLGMGAGGLGQYLRQRQDTVADGVTHNQEEARMARTWYRSTCVADLDSEPLANLVDPNGYDCIVCADVLEHLKAPQSVLDQCKALLKPGGRLIVSVPNAGYCGLIAELIQGDFRYRREGILDNTHLRFFTRKSLRRFFDQHGWATRTVQTTQRSLSASEFGVPFDTLPPAVARYLLAAPDALTYQFICVLQVPDSVDRSVGNAASFESFDIERSPLPHAFYSVQLYLATHGKYDEATKLVGCGMIGNTRQVLSFEIPASSTPYTQIRLDPADRPGFFRMHELTIRLPSGEVAWAWQAEHDAVATLANARHQDILFAPPWEMAPGAMLLLHGDDPWVELPLPADVLQTISRDGAFLELCAGWPMSADYLQASVTIDGLKVTHQRERQTHGAQQAANERAKHELESRITSLQQSVVAADKEMLRLGDVLGATKRDAQAQLQGLIGELRVVERQRGLLEEQFNQLASHLKTIEQSTVFRVTRPFVQMKMRLDSLLSPAPNMKSVPPSRQISSVLPLLRRPVDIIVPVYLGFDDTRCCLESVLGASCLTAWRLIVVNDCSPEPEVTHWLRTFAQQDSRIVLLENPQNLGFVGTVNRGMALSGENDVLLLNSDAEVANDWLDRLQRTAYSAPRVASVTPFSNNATICSYPRFCQPNDLPCGQDTGSLDDLCARHLAGQSVEVPTGVGFCMYVRRDCLHELGLFDEDQFGKGYGEENDFCIRARQAGWVNLHALDVFVRHNGGGSFGDSKSERELAAMDILRRIHPRYESDVHAHVLDDPARGARLTIDLARITAVGRPVILSVMHNRDGGTLRHVQELAGQLGERATFLRLAPVPKGVEVRLEGAHEAMSLHFSLPAERAHLLQTLRRLRVGHIHYHHLLGHDPVICELPDQLGVSHDFTAHDYYSYCPQISLTDHNDRYCGELGLEQCRRCLRRHPAPGGEDIDSWRSRHARLLSRARYVIAPSIDAASRLQRFVPSARVVVVPHERMDPEARAYSEPGARRLPEAQPLRVVVLGALSKIKGADVLEEVATLAAARGAPIEFHLLGFAYRSLRVQPKARLTVHGRYEDKDLAQLLHWLQADAVWFPALWPETYSYTLSASLDSGLPIIAPDFGAFPERLQNRAWTWLRDWRQDAGQWLEFFEHIRREHFCLGVGPDTIGVPGSLAIPCTETDGQTLAYQSDYLEAIPTLPTLDRQQLIELQHGLVSNLLHARDGRLPATALKSVALRALMRLRANRALSPVARAVPMHLQRRVKSWLGK